MRLTAERDGYIEKYSKAARKVHKYKKLLIEAKEKYAMREDDFSASYKSLYDKLKAIKEDKSCFSGACKTKYYEKVRACHQAEGDRKLNADLLEETW